MVRKLLFICGLLSSLLYVAMNIFIPVLYDGYNSASQTVSELSAIGAPTRPLWVLLGIAYTLLVIAFGFGLRISARRIRPLHIVSILMITHGVIDILWPFAPMHQREVLAAGGGTLTDTMHIVISMVTVILMMLMIGFGAAAFEKPFRIYSIVSLAILLFFGVLTGLDAPGISANLPTPWIGVWERINIGVFMVWLAILAILLLKLENKSGLLTAAARTNVKARVTGNGQQSKMKQRI